MSVVNFVVFLCGLAFLLYKYSTRTFNFWRSRNVEGPEPTPLFGNYLRNVLGREYRSVLIGKIYNQFPKEKIVGIYKFTTPLLLIRDPEIIKHVLVKDFECFQSRGIEFSKDGLGANLFHSDGDTWSVLRKKITPVFTSAKLKGMLYLMKDRASEFVKYVANVTEEGKPVEINSLVEKLTAEIIGTTAFGVNINAYNGDFNEYLYIGKKITTPTLRLTLDMLKPGVLKVFNMDMFSGEIRDFFYGLVKAVLREREGRPKVRHDFMDLLIELKEQGNVSGNKVRSDDAIDLDITENVLAAQAFIFYTAGYETSSATLTQMLYELALNPDIQNKLVQEIDNVLSKHNNELTYEAINEMKYLDMVLAETLRKYPVIDIMRKSVRDYKVPGTKLTIPKGINIVIPTLALQNDPVHYPDPDKFIPERFSPENVALRHPGVYLPFGIGPRECIGIRFTLVANKINMIYFLKAFRVEPSAGMSDRLEYSANRFTLQVDGGVWLHVRRK